MLTGPVHEFLHYRALARLQIPHNGAMEQSQSSGQFSVLITCIIQPLLIMEPFKALRPALSQVLEQVYQDPGTSVRDCKLSLIVRARVSHRMQNFMFCSLTNDRYTPTMMFYSYNLSRKSKNLPLMLQ